MSSPKKNKGIQLDEESITELYEFINSIPLSKTKRNLTRDFSDALLMAEVIKNFYPKSVDIHNYIPASSIQKKLYNWRTLKRKVTSKINFPVSEMEIKKISNSRNGYVQAVLLRFIAFLQKKGKLVQKERKTQQPTENAKSDSSNGSNSSNETEQSLNTQSVNSGSEIDNTSFRDPLSTNGSINSDISSVSSPSRNLPRKVMTSKGKERIVMDENSPRKDGKSIVSSPGKKKRKNVGGGSRITKKRGKKSIRKKKKSKTSKSVVNEVEEPEPEHEPEPEPEPERSITELQKELLEERSNRIAELEESVKAWKDKYVKLEAMMKLKDQKIKSLKKRLGGKGRRK